MNPDTLEAIFRVLDSGAILIAALSAWWSKRNHQRLKRMEQNQNNGTVHARRSV